MSDTTCPLCGSRIQDPEELRRKRIGDNLRRYREESALTQVELGEMLGVTGNYISAIETGRDVLPTMMLVDVCKLFGIGYSDILDEPTNIIDPVTSNGAAPEMTEAPALYDLPSLLAYIRQELNYTTKQIAKVAGLSYQHWNNCEMGRTNMSPSMLRSIYDRLHNHKPKWKVLDQLVAYANAEDNIRREAAAAARAARAPARN